MSKLLTCSCVGYSRAGFGRTTKSMLKNLLKMPKPPRFANEDEIKAVIRERIKSERTKSKIKGKDIAGLLQLDISAISNIENGRRDIQPLELFLIAELLEVSIDSFFPPEAKRLVQKAPKHLDHKC